MTVHQELFKAASKAPGDFVCFAAGESKADYHVRLMKAIAKTPEAEYDALSPEGQQWYLDAIKAYNVEMDGAAIPDVPGFVYDDPGKAETAAAPAKKVNKGMEAIKAKREAAKAEKEKAEKPAPAKKAAAKKEDAPAKPAKPVKAEKPAKPEKAAKPAKVEPPVKEAVPTLNSATRRIMIQNPDFKEKDLRAALVAEGWDDTKLKKNILSIACGEARLLIAEAKRLGYWRDKPAA